MPDIQHDAVLERFNRTAEAYVQHGAERDATEKLAKRLERRRQGSQPGEEGGAAEPEMETPIRESEQSYQATNTDKVLS